jgi:hypothetical protein
MNHLLHLLPAVAPQYPAVARGHSRGLVALLADGDKPLQIYHLEGAVQLP